MKYQYFVAAFIPHMCASEAVLVEPWAENHTTMADDLADGIRYDSEAEAEEAIAEHGVKGRHYIVLKTLYIY